MTTCQSPVAARDFAALRPNPEEAPVMITVCFWSVGGADANAAGFMAATAELATVKAAALLRLDTARLLHACCARALPDEGAARTLEGATLGTAAAQPRASTHLEA